MDEILMILVEIGLPFAYSHFAEGESPDPPFVIYLLPGSDNFSADGRVYYTETLSLTADPREDGLVKSRTGDTTSKATYDGWYTAVYVPQEETEPAG